MNSYTFYNNLSHKSSLQGWFSLGEDSHQLWFDTKHVDVFSYSFAFVRFEGEGYEMKIYPINRFEKDGIHEALIKFGDKNRGKKGIFYLMLGEKFQDTLLHGDNLWEENETKTK